MNSEDECIKETSVVCLQATPVSSKGLAWAKALGWSPVSAKGCPTPKFTLDYGPLSPGGLGETQGWKDNKSGDMRQREKSTSAAFPQKPPQAENGKIATQSDKTTSDSFIKAHTLEGGGGHH